MKVKLLFVVGFGCLLMGSAARGQGKQVIHFKNGGRGVFNCDDENNGLCYDLRGGKNYEGKYSGHDEPVIGFYSNRSGAGRSSIYLLTLPKDPPTLPTQDGKGGVFNFQLHPTFWFGVALCDSQSAPNFTNVCFPGPTRTSSTTQTRMRPIGSGITRERHLSKCSSIRRDGLGRPSFRFRTSGFRRW